MILELALSQGFKASPGLELANTFGVREQRPKAKDRRPSAYAPISRRILDQRSHIIAGQPFATGQEFQLDDEYQTDNYTA